MVSAYFVSNRALGIARSNTYIYESIHRRPCQGDKADKAFGEPPSISGGYGSNALNKSSSVSGGFGSKALGDYLLVLGGKFDDAKDK